MASDGKSVGMFALEVFKIVFDLLYIGIVVAGRDDLPCAADELAFIVDAIEEDGYAGLEGDVIESAFPLGDGRACTLRGDTQTKGGAIYGLAGEGVGEAGLPRALHGNAAPSTKEGAERPEKPFFLHKEIDGNVFGKTIAHAQHEVPVGGVWSEGDDEFVGVGDGDFFAPSPPLIEEPTKELHGVFGQGIIRGQLFGR